METFPNENGIPTSSQGAAAYEPFIPSPATIPSNSTNAAHVSVTSDLVPVLPKPQVHVTNSGHLDGNNPPNENEIPTSSQGAAAGVSLIPDPATTPSISLQPNGAPHIISITSGAGVVVPIPAPDGMGKPPTKRKRAVKAKKK